jgi:hypothetical protein
MALDRLIRVLTSLRLTVICLALALVLVFLGTLAQVDLGLYKAQNEFFRSFFIYWGPQGAAWKIPVFPGGYLVGGMLLLNLIASHIRRFQFSGRKAGLWMIHAGLILLLLGQLLTDMLARESALHLREGEAKNYSESTSKAELAVIDITDRALDTVVAIPQHLLAQRSEVRHPQLPFSIRIREYYANSIVENRGAGDAAPPAATKGLGPQVTVREAPRVTETDRRDQSSAVVEVVTPQGSLGTWLVSESIEQPQSFSWNGLSYQMALRPVRYYKPFTIQLRQFRHDIYAGTDIPRNFSSLVAVQRPDTGESRDVLIYMNRPLRYGGETFYQASYDEDDHGTVLQVVHNPGWLTPYVACVLVGAGLLLHFAMHLFGFAWKRRVA